MIEISAIDIRQWTLVLAGVSDFTRPAKDLSLSQNLALTATGAIWTRWCFIIKPQNLLYGSPANFRSPLRYLLERLAYLFNFRLAAVNFFLGCVGVTQVTRILMYQRSMEGGTIPEVLEANAKDGVETAKQIAQNPEGAAKKALN